MRKPLSGQGRQEVLSFMCYIHSKNIGSAIGNPPLRLTLPAISPVALVPLHEQVMAGVRHEMATGRCLRGALPSFRTLADGLMVSVIT